ncbi:hypothetical protein EVAR_28801_1 [Eumeta japonica]|uniref:Craniofacial development protein 2 n=1 Tax=Eumeta variegata TaxID=151549 RepID=A0A4C1WHF9_EUMVA|nr:hypothetical protein EVAR_28801_1 [Eumeta japonica]
MVKFVGVYAPYVSKLLEEQEKCWVYARDVLMECDRNERILILGDFNGCVGVQQDRYEKVLEKGYEINVGKTKVTVFERRESTTESDILIEGEKVEQMKEFVYLGSLFTNDGKHDRDIERRVKAGNKMNRALLAIMNGKSVSQQTHGLAIHNGVLISMFMYGSESWKWRAKQGKTEKKWEDELKMTVDPNWRRVARDRLQRKQLEEVFARKHAQLRDIL